MNNCSFEHNAADVSSVVVTAAGTGDAEVMISNTYFTRYANLAYTQPTVVVGAGAGAYLTMTGCRTPQIGTGSGTFVSIGADNLHRLTGNVALRLDLRAARGDARRLHGQQGRHRQLPDRDRRRPVATTTSANIAALSLAARRLGRAWRGGVHRLRRCRADRAAGGLEHGFRRFLRCAGRGRSAGHIGGIRRRTRQTPCPPAPRGSIPTSRRRSIWWRRRTSLRLGHRPGFIGARQAT